MESPSFFKSPPGRLVRFLTLASALFASLPHALSQTALTNGLIEYDGKIDWGDVDEWVFNAEAGDFISLRMAVDEYKDEAPTPYIYLDFNGEVLWSESGNFRFDMNKTLIAPYTGKYHIQIGDVNGVPLLGRIEYILSLAQSGSPFTTREGDQGGPLTNGLRHSGQLIRGDSDMWSFEVEAGQNIDISVVETEAFGNLSIGLRVFDETGASVASDFDSTNSKVNFIAESAGTYTVIVQNDSTDDDANGSYHLYYSNMSQEFTVPDDDEGGTLQNGARTLGTIDTGDVDLWTFDAEIGDPVSLSLAKTGGSLTPHLHVFAPDGSSVVWGSDSDNAKLFLVAEQTGTYFVKAENGHSTAPEYTGPYHLYYSNMSQEFTVSEGDEGGPLQNGARTLGTIDTGDVDLWTFDAEVGNPVYLSFTETGGNFSPYLIVFSPDGTTAAWDSDNGNAEVFLTAEQTGRYVISVENGNANAPELTGSYKLTYFNTPSNDGYVGFVLSEGYPLAGSGFQDDLNEDGFSNGLAYALGLPINQPFSDTSPTLVISAASSNPVLEFRLPEQRPNDIVYKVEFSTDLTTQWAPIATLESNATSWQLNHENGVIETDGYDVRIGMKSEQETHDDIFLRLTVGIE